VCALAHEYCDRSRLRRSALASCWRSSRRARLARISSSSCATRSSKATTSLSACVPVCSCSRVSARLVASDSAIAHPAPHRGSRALRCLRCPRGRAPARTVLDIGSCRARLALVGTLLANHALETMRFLAGDAVLGGSDENGHALDENARGTRFGWRSSFGRTWSVGARESHPRAGDTRRPLARGSVKFLDSPPPLS
jgi:hypothetical protein